MKRCERGGPGCPYAAAFAVTSARHAGHGLEVCAGHLAVTVGEMLSTETLVEVARA
jgi:hypothetical protein